MWLIAQPTLWRDKAGIQVVRPEWEANLRATRLKMPISREVDELLYRASREDGRPAPATSL